MEKLSAENEGWPASEARRRDDEPKDLEGQDQDEEAGGDSVVSSAKDRNEEEVIPADEGGARLKQANECREPGKEETELTTRNAGQGEDKVTVEGEGVVGGVGDQWELEAHDGDVDAGEEEGKDDLIGDGQDQEQQSEKESAEGPPDATSFLGSEVALGRADNSGAQEGPQDYGDGSVVEPLQQGSREPSSPTEKACTGPSTADVAGVPSEELEGIGDGISTQELSEGAPQSKPSPSKPLEVGSDLTTEAALRVNSFDEDDETVHDVQEKQLPESQHASPRGTEQGWGASATELSENPSAQTANDDGNQAEETIGVLSQVQAEDLNKTEPLDAEKREKENENDSEEEEVRAQGDVERSSGPAASSAPGGAAQGPSLGSAGPSLPERPNRTARSNPPPMESAPLSHSSSHADDSHSNGEAATAPAAADGNDETREKLHAIRIKLLRLASRLGQSAHSPVVAQVLYRLGLAEQLRGGGGQGSSRNAAFSFDRAMATAAESEAAGPGELDFICTIMLLGKTGVGKSATVNSIFDQHKTGTDAFGPSTTKVRVITGYVNGAKVRVIDTPGLLPSLADQRYNRKAMASVKWLIRKQAPDIVLYFDRLDMQSRDYGDLPLLRTITDTFGAAVWFNAIVVLTHAASAPPDSPNGLPFGYDMFVSHRSHAVQQTIRQAAGDVRLMNPVSLVENHPSCRVNRLGQRVLPSGQVWKPQLLMLCFASKILAEANSVLKLQDSAPGRTRARVPPLPFLLSSLLQSRAQLRMPDEQGGDEEDASDDELEEDDDSDDEEDYDQLPPFRRLSKEELAELDKDNRGKYFEELAERERLFQKKQWKEEKKRRREWKGKVGGEPVDQSQFADEGVEDDLARTTSVAVPMADLVLPPSFDSENPTHRYRYLETANQWLVRPVLEAHGWDHDTGYDGMNVEKAFDFGNRIPASVAGQIIKDKKDTNLNLECAASLKLGAGVATLAGLDVQSVGKDVAYTLRSETGFSNFKRNKTTGGLAMTVLGDTISTGMKIEDRLIIGKRVKVIVSGGTITGRGDAAYGGSLEATLRGKDYPFSRTLSSLGLSIMDWHGDLAIGGNLQSQFMLGKIMMVGRTNLNNRGAGQITLKASSSEQVQMALIGLLPIIRSLVNHLLGWSQSQE